MDKKKIIINTLIITSFLALALLFAVQNDVYAAGTPQKSETVYVNLDAKGVPQQTTVTDWLHSDMPGIILSDRTILENIINVKSDEEPQQEGKNLTWKIQGNDIYYQGTTDKALPFNVNIKYFLNGNEMAPQDMAGKSGLVKINIKFENTDLHTVQIEGSEIQMSTPLTAIVIMNMPSDTFSNIETDNGQVFSDGNNQIVTFLAMPGMKDNLNLDNYSIEELKDIDLPEELTVTTQAENFSLGSIAIAATTALPDMDDIKKSDDFNAMKQDLLDLQDMQDDLETIDPDRDIRSLITNTNRTDTCRLLINDLFDFYDIDDTNTSLIDMLPDYITKENIDLYDRVKADLDDVDIDYILDNQVFRTLPERLTDENIEKSRTLVADYDTIKDLDMDIFDDLLDILDDYDKIDDMVDTGLELKDKLDDHEDELDTLSTLSFYSDDLADLFGELADSGLLSSFSEEDLNIFLDAGLATVAENKADQSAAYYKSMIDSDGNIAEENRTTIAYFVTQATAAGSVDEATGNYLISLIQAGNIGAEGSDTYNAVIAIIEGCIESSAADSTAAMKQEMLSLFSELESFQNKMENRLGSDYQEKIEDALDFLSDISSDLRFIKSEAKDNDDEIDDLVDFFSDEDNIDYLQEWGPKLRDMKNDLDDNEENLEILRDLLNEYDDPRVKHLKEKYDVLLADLDEVRPVLDSLSNRLDEEDINLSLHNSPDIIQQLMSMRTDINDNRDIAGIIRDALAQNNTDLTKNMIATLDRLEAKDTVGDALEKIDNIDELLARKDAMVALSDNYDIFTDKGNDMESELKFIMKTGEIKALEEEVATTTNNQEEHPGFFAWCKNIAVMIKNKIVSIV